MLRLILLALVVLALCIYAWRDWFASLCGLVLLTTFTQHTDMPRTIMGIPGLNPWNLVFLAVVAAWAINRKRSPWQSPKWVKRFLIAYLLLLVVGAARTLPDTGILRQREVILSTIPTLVMDLILNPFKYIAVGLLMYDGARTQRRLWMSVFTLVGSGLLHALMMYKTMRQYVFLGDYEDARRMTDKMIGLHANDLAALLVMSFWIAVVVGMALKGKWRWACFGAAATFVPAIYGCHSRTAYLALVMVAVVMGVVRWRRLLIAVPVIAMVTFAFFGGFVENIAADFEIGTPDHGGSRDLNELTTGRTSNIWAPTVDQIGEAPFIGHGRLAVWRTKCYTEILYREFSVPSHPHNSYLEVLVDSGIVGLFIVLGLLFSIWWISALLMRSRGDPLESVVGSVGFAAIVHVLGLGLSSNYFYPKQSMLWLICCSAVVVRVWTFRQSAFGDAGVRRSRVRPQQFSVRAAPELEGWGRARHARLSPNPGVRSNQRKSGGTGTGQRT